MRNIIAYLIVVFGVGLSGAGHCVAATVAVLPTGQGNPTIQTTPGKSLYQQLVDRAEAGDKTVDFDQLRKAYLTEGVDKRVWQQRPHIESLREDMIFAEKTKNMNSLRLAAQSLLAIKYTDMLAHKFMAQACAFQGQKACEDHYEFTQMGLLQSMLKTGDGKTCGSAWKVVSADEEYFILSMLRLRLIRHEFISMDGHRCDEMRVADKTGGERNYYFNVDAVLPEERAAYNLQ
jgi:hypothetical protein